jgi:NIPSNAP
VITLCIRYTIDPNRLRAWREYAENEQPVIQRCGGEIIAYWAPTDFAGPTNIAYGIIDFPTLAAYEQYRKVLADDPDHKRNAETLEMSGAVIALDRQFIQRIPYAGS